MVQALRLHWREYSFEALGLGMFMVSACLFGALLEYPASAAHQAIPDALARRVLMGVAMGATAVGIIYSPWGRRSGAHINPAVTLTYFRLGRVPFWDACFYIIAQFAGGAAGVLVSRWTAPGAVMHPSVNYVVTVPGTAGVAAAAAAELAISFGLMLAVLTVSGNRRSAPYTGLVAGALVAVYIALEAPYSGMSMNPARTAASAVVARVWTASWIYFVVPPLAMLLAAEVHVRARGWARVGCAKLHHDNRIRCIFCGSSQFEEIDREEKNR
jgi:aquaporin Z